MHLPFIVGLLSICIHLFNADVYYLLYETYLPFIVCLLSIFIQLFNVVYYLLAKMYQIYRFCCCCFCVCFCVVIIYFFIHLFIVCLFICLLTKHCWLIVD